MTTKMMKVVGAFGIGLLGTEIIWQLWKNIRHHCKLASSSEDKTINEVLIFSDECSLCRSHASTKVPCSNKCPVFNVMRLIHYLDSSTVSLDICMYILTCYDITRAIIKAQQRKIVVRVIVDGCMSETGPCFEQLERLKRNGVRVRIRRSNTSLMHHKFAIIDGKIMIYGSTNWTMQAFYGNFDGILITNHCELVTPIKNEFNKMWKVMQ